MELSHEDIVTRMLSKREILEANSGMGKKIYSTNPAYDLSLYLKTAKPEPSRWGAKYKFVT